jgi:hypothetical protein
MMWGNSLYRDCGGGGDANIGTLGIYAPIKFANADAGATYSLGPYVKLFLMINTCLTQ